MSEAVAPGLTGFIDHVDWHGMRGWAYDPAAPDEPQWLEVRIDDDMPVAFLANLRRQDLVDAGYGEGTYGFELRFPVALDPLRPHNVVICRRQDMLPLPNSPIRLEGAPMGDAERRRVFEEMVQAEIAATVSGDEAQAMISYLLTQVDALLEARAGAITGTTALQQFRLRWNDYLDGVRARPLEPDTRPWLLLAAADLPDTALQVATIRAVQALGYRVAVLGQRDMPQGGPVAESLAAMEVRVFGAPDYAGLEDVLRRHRGLFRVVFLWGTMVAATYAVLTRTLQPKTRLVSVLGDLAVDRIEPAMLVSAAMLNDHLIVDSDEAKTQIGVRLPAKPVIVAAPDSEAAAMQTMLEPLLPRLRPAATRPPDALDPA